MNKTSTRKKCLTRKELQLNNLYVNKHITLAMAWQAIEDKNMHVALKGFSQHIKYENPRPLTRKDQIFILELNRYRQFMDQIAKFALHGNNDALVLLHYNADVLLEIAQSALHLYHAVSQRHATA